MARKQKLKHTKGMEIATMITATTFSRGYSSFWHEVTPWLNAYVNHINTIELKAYGNPIELNEPQNHKSINNLISTIHFENEYLNPDKTQSITKSKTNALSIIKYLPKNFSGLYKLSKENRKIIEHQVANLRKNYSKEITFNPRFPGYSAISDCEGDFVSGTSLVEIKAGDRKISPGDIRQVIIYLILNKLSKNPITIKNIEIYNPRHDKKYKSPIEDLFFNISNTSFTEICSYFEFFIDATYTESV